MSETKKKETKKVSEEKTVNYFQDLNSIDVSSKVEKKGGLSYLSWAWAWGELKKRHPEANYHVYETSEGVNYFTDGRTAWVKTGVEVNRVLHVEHLPIMDFKNRSIPLENITSFEVNKAIQRCITKAIARHGLGLYIYAGEDLPEESDGGSTVAPAKKPIDPVLKQKQKVVGLLKTLKIAYTPETIEEIIQDRTQLALVDENLTEIIERLQVLVAENAGA